jgi:hypothetical protein
VTIFESNADPLKDLDVGSPRALQLVTVAAKYAHIPTTAETRKAIVDQLRELISMPAPTTAISRRKRQARQAWEATVEAGWHVDVMPIAHQPSEEIDSSAKVRSSLRPISEGERLALCSAENADSGVSLPGPADRLPERK